MNVSHWGFFPGHYGTKLFGVDSHFLREDRTSWHPCSFDEFFEHADFLETLKKYPQ